MLIDLENSIITGDCLNILSQIEDNSIDVTFADPPFNLGKKYNGYSDNKNFDVYLDWCEQWLKQMVRITKPTGSIFVHNIPLWLTHYSTILNRIATFKHWISWEAPTAPMGKSLQPSHYGILFYKKNNNVNKYYEIRHPHKRCRKCGYLLKDYGGKKNQLHPFGPLVSDVWTDIHRIRHSKYRDEHPCQLPVALLERLILMSTDENDIVLDPFVGTGTTVLAAKRLGRRYVGIDLNTEYTEISQRKLDKENFISKLGDSWVSYHLKQVTTIRDRDWESLSAFFETPDDIKSIDFSEIKMMDR